MTNIHKFYGSLTDEYQWNNIQTCLQLMRRIIHTYYIVSGKKCRVIFDYKSHTS